MSLTPALSSCQRAFEPDDKGSCSVRRVVMEIPGSDDGVLKVGKESPGVFEMEKRGFRNGSTDLNIERHVIRSGASKGGEDRVREQGIPSEIDKGPVQAFKSGDASAIGPSELPIQQRQLNEAKILNGVIKGLSLGSVEIVIIFSHEQSGSC